MMFTKKILAIITSLSIMGISQAQVSSVNPMTPRQLSETSYEKDNTFGYSLLTGGAIDMFEKANRAGFYINYNLLDRYILRPVSHGYAALPQWTQIGVGNFLSNLDDAISSIDNVFILEFKNSGTSLSRFAINSTVGLLGFIDVASNFGINRAQMDMGTVFGTYGQEQGPFLMIPFYGPTTARDLQGDTIDNIPYFFIPWYISLGKSAITLVHERAQLIGQEGVIDNAFDPYTQSRDVYLMYRYGLYKHTQEDQQEATSNSEVIDDAYLDEIDE